MNLYASWLLIVLHILQALKGACEEEEDGTAAECCL